MPELEGPHWNSIVEFINDINRCDELGLISASLVMSYVCIDTMSSLCIPATQQKASRTDFKSWVDTYLKGDPEQPYQYRGKDVYAARCAMLHTYGSEAELHTQDPDTIKYAYHDGGRHFFDPQKNATLVIIGTRSFVHDVTHAVLSFMESCIHNEELRQLVEPRLNTILRPVPLQQATE